MLSSACTTHCSSLSACPQRFHQQKMDSCGRWSLNINDICIKLKSTVTCLHCFPQTRALQATWQLQMACGRNGPCWAVSLPPLRGLQMPQNLLLVRYLFSKRGTRKTQRRRTGRRQKLRRCRVGRPLRGRGEKVRGGRVADNELHREGHPFVRVLLNDE